jgi:thiol:disulfide interchange protein DsbC
MMALALSQTASAEVSKEEQALVQSIVKSTQISKINKAPMQGFYEVYMPNGQLLYVNPFSELIFFGEIYTRGGTNLTADNRAAWQDELQSSKLDSISSEEIDKLALTVDYNGGSQRYSLVMFTDPQCPFCKRAEEFLRSKKATVKYVYYIAVPSHRQAPEMIETILASNDPRSVIEMYLDGVAVDTVKEKDAEKKAKAMQAYAERLGIRGTPNFIVIDNKTGKAVEMIKGANNAKLENYVD